MAVLLIGIVAIALFTGQPSTPPTGTTAAQLQEGGTVSIGQPFIMKFGTDEVPVRVVFDAAWFTTTHEYSEAESGYKFVVIQLKAQNIGNKEVDTFGPLDKWEVTVDKGYLYQAKSSPYLDVRPEETKTGYVTFEILEQTYPTEVRYRQFLSSSPSIRLNLREYHLVTTTAAARESLYLDSYKWLENRTLILEVRNYGSVTAIVHRVYIDALLVSDQDFLTKPSSVVEIMCSTPLDLSLEPGSRHEVRIVTMVGNTFEFTVYYR